jgi:hypothetical protein
MSDQWPDEVKRICDAMNMHTLAGSAHSYAVFSLQDGRPITNDVYPSRAQARRMANKKTQDHLLILEVQPDGMQPNHAAACLKYERTLISAGVRTPDHFETEENSGLLSMPLNRHDQKRMVHQLKTGKPLYPESVPYGNLPVRNS